MDQWQDVFTVAPFSWARTGSGTDSANYNVDTVRITVTFNASKRNSIYGSSETVAPLSESCLICIRY